MRRPEYLVFEDSEVPAGRKTRVVAVLSARSRNELGVIAWYSPWRQYVFYPDGGTLWNNGCLTEIAERVRKMTVDHRRELQDRRRALAAIREPVV